MLFTIQSDVKHRCIFSTDFDIFSSKLMRFVFRQSKGVYLHATSNGKLFYLVCLNAKTKVHTVLTRKMLFDVDAALTMHTETQPPTTDEKFELTNKEKEK